MVLAEIHLGAARRAAFTHLAERVGLDDIRALTTATVQADELSMSIVESMHIQSRSLRVKRRQEVEADAQRAPVKMLIPDGAADPAGAFYHDPCAAVLQLMKVFTL